MCGGGSPPPPPDYTPQKNQIAQATEARYAQQANEYNTAVNNYNNALRGHQGTLSTLGGNIGGLNMTSLWDDPNTAENENMYDKYMGELNSLNNSLGSMSFDMARPNFSSSVNSAYGTVGITNIPSLNNVNSNLYNQLYSTGSSLANQLNSLKQQRDTETNRVNDFRNNMVADLSGYGTTLGQLTIADQAQMNQLERDLAATQARRNAFSSPLMNQLYPQGFADFDNYYSSIMSDLSSLRGERAAEEQRIKDFESGLYEAADSYNASIGNMTIADLAQMNQIQDAIDAQQRSASRFSSALGYDLSQELGALSEAEIALNKLRQERANEENRINNARADFLNSARAIEQAAEGGNIYSQASLDALSDRLRDTRTDMGNFSSILGYDFSNATTSLNEAEAALKALTEKRASTIDKFIADIGGASSGIGDIALSDEAAMRDRLSQLNKLNLDLSPYSGGRVDQVQAQLDTGIQAVNARLQELSDYRAQLEQNAQAMLEKVRNASYYATGDLTGDQTDFAAMQAEAELYNAQAAMDEIDAIMGRLNSEKQRLEADAEAVAARTSASQNAILSSLGSGGIPEFADFSQVDPTTLQEYLAMLSDEEEEETFGLSPSAFSNSLGIIKVG